MYRDAEQREFARKLRREMTDAERKLWRSLRCEQLRGWKFRRQAAIGAYIVDFVCFDAKLVVELDGGQHNTAEGKHHDLRRTAWLESQGFRVVRFWNHDALEDADALVEAIAFALKCHTGVAGT
ncbi:hypothetical protein Pla108_09240 [Botrimarina colliarenosi]|uniref:DUF559 domain-containing protein n=1 Tax=Botrimarina colliarenosi TaxID=2528001 RepID=A0A5C6AKP7_9BACT|nr:endonuclease domain-containing protein [Botrimarina colliarenosi]TWT99980.1 hypothetical protein Pla108_09240 [Botrimarina colliarenosi]